MRYADECNIYVGSERSGHRVMTSVVQFIESRLRLKVNTTKSAVAKPEERHFLGFRLRKREDGDVEVLLSKRSVERIDEKIRELTARNWGQGIDACIKHVNRYLIGWICFFGIVSDGVARKLGNIDAHIRRRLSPGLTRRRAPPPPPTPASDRGRRRCLRGPWPAPLPNPS